MWRIVRRSRATRRVTKRYASGLESHDAARRRLATLSVKPNTDREHVVIESYLAGTQTHLIRAKDIKAPMGRARFWRGSP
jgi:hypothetical protein